MNRAYVSSAVFLALGLTAFLAASAELRSDAALPPYRTPLLPIEQRVHDLLSRMTLDEKVAQVRSIWPGAKDLFDDHGNFSSAKATPLLNDGIGEMGTVLPPDEMLDPGAGARLANAVQKFLIENTRLGIPVIVHGEALHGFMARGATSYPQAIALASTWDVNLVQQVFGEAAQEARARGTNQVFAPVLDVARDPRWGRTEETYGEDPYLVSQMGVACISGLQGQGPAIDTQHVVSTPKHFAGYGWTEGGRNGSPSDHSERVYREDILPPFEAAVRDAGALSIMASYNEVDGIPANANRWLLGRILRQEWGFRGLVVSDYYAIQQLDTIHHVSPGCAAATKRALEAGVDVDTPDGTCYATLVSSVREGRVAEAVLDQAVARVLRTKFLLGLFEHPYVDPAQAEEVCQLPTHRSSALQAAREAVILLKNENHLLPLDRAKVRSIAVIGPNAAVTRLGEYSGVPPYTVSILDGIKRQAGSTITVRYALGCRITAGNRGWWDDKVELEDPRVDEQTIAEAVRAAQGADVALIAVGDNDQTSREAYSQEHLGDRDSLDLVGEQLALVKAIVATGKPVVVVLINGRPASVPYIAAHVPAILEGWSLGQETGTAIAEVLFGDYNPGGKLPITIPRSVGQLPDYYDHVPAMGRPYLLANSQPLFPFGYGLSYTTFRYDNLQVSPAEIHSQGQTRVGTDVTNTGSREGDAVVELYVRDEVSSVARPVEELKGFKRIRLAAGEKRRVEFSLNATALAFYNEDMLRTVEPGLFKIMVGGSSDNVVSSELKVADR